jgi:mannose-6-phosphate isomerase-like protein (cupin superfamily)
VKTAVPKIAAAAALTLALLTGIAVGLLGDLRKSEPTLVAASDPETSRTASAFYEAVNHFLSTDDDSDLLMLLHEDFVDHTHQDGSARTLLRDLASLRRTHPGFRVRMKAIETGGDIALMTLDGTDNRPGTFLGLPTAGQDMFPDSETVRIANAKVIERWGNIRTTSLYEPYSTIALPLDVTMGAGLQLMRWTFQPHAEQAFVCTRDSLFIVESGEFSLIVEKGRQAQASLHHPQPEGNIMVESVTSSETITLRPDDVLMLPLGTSYRLRNVNPEASSFIGLETYSPTPMADQIAATERGVNRQTVDAGLYLPASQTPYMLHLGKAVLAPGSSFPRHMVRGGELMVIISGSLYVTGFAPGVFTGNPNEPFSTLDTQTRLLTGGGIAANPHSEVSYQVIGDKPAVIWLITLHPTHET